MRTTTVNGFTINYPDSIVWTQDHSPVTVSGTGPVGAVITVFHPAGETRTLSYMSPLEEVTFYLDTTLRELDNDNIGDYRCELALYQNYTLVTTFSFWFKVYKGKSFQDRTHGTSQYMYIYDMTELIKLQIWSPSAGTASINGSTFNINPGLNSLNLSSVITGTGLYTICLSDPSSSTLDAFIISDNALTPTSSTLMFKTKTEEGEPQIGGNVIKSASIFPVCHTIEVSSSCEDYPFAELMYRDTDGCTRYLGGIIENDTPTVKRTAYTRLDDSVYKDVPRSVLSDSNNMIKVQFNDIDIHSNFQDILYSDVLMLRRRWDNEPIPVRLKTDKLVVDAKEDLVDFELEIYYMD